MGATRATFLFKVPSWADGAATVFDLRGEYTRYAYSPTGAEADRRALEQDWFAVADDLRAAARRFVEPHRRAR